MAYCIVTGAAGFIGSHLAEALILEGHDVVGIDGFTAAYSRPMKLRNLAALSEAPNFKFMEKRIEQLTSEDLVSEAAYVFHLAGQPGVRESWGAGFEEYVQNNIVATQALLELLRARRPKRLILASSSSVYGAGAGRAMHETDHTAPLSPYGVTKVAAEKLCLAYAQEYSIPTTILRFFSVYGPRQRPDMLVYKLIAAALGAQPVRIFGSREQTRDFTYVSDIVRGAVAAIHTSTPAGIFNLANGVSVPLDQCITTLETLAGCSIPLVMAERNAGDPAQTLGDTSRAKSALKYNPAVSLADGLRQQWEWMWRARITGL